MLLPKRHSLKSEHSSKFFTLVIDTSCYHQDANTITKTKAQEGNDGMITTKVSAKKGKNLYEVLQSVLERYEMSCETHSLFLGASPNSALVPYTHDAQAYREHTIYVRANEKCHAIPFTRTRNESKKSIAIVVKRFSQLLGEFESREDMEDGSRELNQDEFYLESSWKDVVTETDHMSKRQKLQQEGVWELLTSEIGYIQDIKVIIDVFKRNFDKLQESSYMTEIDPAVIFANIQEIYEVNLKFWRKLKVVVDRARNTKEPVAPSHLSSCFEDFEHLFQPYIDYCNADNSNLKVLDYAPPTNELLKKYVDWCNNHQMCKRLTLPGFLIKPLQRVTKYSLLLKAIMNKTDDVTERDVAEQVMARVETFVSKINSTVHLRQEMEKMGSVIARISDYYPVEMFTEESEKIIKEYCQLDLRRNIPGLGGEKSRLILKEGPMKLVEKQGKKEVYVFLFSDCFIITKLKKYTDQYRIIRPPYRLKNTRIHSLKDPGQLLLVYLTKFGVVASACILQTGTGEQEMWKRVIEKAREDYATLRRQFAMQQDEEEDQDILEPCISSNECLIRRISLVPEVPSPTEDPVEITEEVDRVDIVAMVTNPPCEYEWDDTLIFVFAFLFFLFNFYSYRGLSWLISFF